MARNTSSSCPVARTSTDPRQVRYTHDFVNIEASPRGPRAVSPRHVAALAVAGITAAAAVGVPADAASADAPTVVYVNNAATANCSDHGTGAQDQPYCTITAASTSAVPGQTIMITGGYAEHVTITRSGTPGAPITLQQTGQAYVRLTGAAAGITIDGQHDITMVGFLIRGTVGAPSVAVHDSSRINLKTLTTAPAYNGGSQVGVSLTGVTDSSLTNSRVYGDPLTVGVLLDAATSGVRVQSVNTGATIAAGGRGIDVYGSNNTIGGNDVAIVVEPGATGTIVANNYLYGGLGEGIVNTAATGTAITNNSVFSKCGIGIRISGASAGVSVQNNLLAGNATPSVPPCDTPVGDNVQIGLYDAAVHTTVVDYNTVSGRYALDTPVDLDTFRAATGQAAHDIQSAWVWDALDNANSAAPGYQDIDFYGKARYDNPDLTNNGTGPVTYADRGCQE